MCSRSLLLTQKQVRVATDMAQRLLGSQNTFVGNEHFYLYHCDESALFARIPHNYYDLQLHRIIYQSQAKVPQIGMVDHARLSIPCF